MVFWLILFRTCRIVAVSRRTSAPYALTDASGNLQCSGRQVRVGQLHLQTLVGKVLLSKQTFDMR